MAGHGSRGARARRAAQRRTRQLTGPVRRWPWAVAATVAGAVAGAAVAVMLRRGRLGAVDVQEPDEVQAVVDRPDGTTTGT
jgi:hypothetical protein